MKNLLRNLFRLNWWNTQISFKKSAWIFAITVPLISILAIPTQVTVDSIFYVASAKSLFTPDFAEYYIWYREPGYPVLLSLIHLAGNSALYVQAVQALFMGISVWMLLYAFRRTAGFSTLTYLQLGLALLFIFNPMFFSYSGNFLQQAFFCFILASFAVFVEWGRKLPKHLTDRRLILLTLSLYVIAVLTSVGWLYFAVFPILIVFINIVMRWNNNRIAKKKVTGSTRQIVLGIVAAVLLTAFSFGLGRVVYAGWESFKAPYATQVNYETTVVSPDSLPQVGNPIDIAVRFLALMDIVHVDPYEPQNEIFSEAAMRLRFLHSEWDTAYVNKPTTDYAPGYFVLSDPSLIGHSVFSILAPVGQPVYKVTYGAFALLTLLLLIRRKWSALAIALIPMSFIFIHAANNTPVDRYGIPGYPFAIALVTLGISWLATRNFTTVANKD
jgi:hypothetical protein